MTVSALGYVSWVVWFYNDFYYFKLEVQFIDEAYKELFYPVYIPFTLSPFLLSAILTLLLLRLDRLSCCCSWTRVPGEEISVYDPSMDKRYIMYKYIYIMKDWEVDQ